MFNLFNLPVCHDIFEHNKQPSHKFIKNIRYTIHNTEDGSLVRTAIMDIEDKEINWFLAFFIWKKDDATMPDVKLMSRPVSVCRDVFSVLNDDCKSWTHLLFYNSAEIQRRKIDFFIKYCILD